MQRPLAVAQPALYFGLKEPARKYGDTVAPGCGYMRGPFVFRRRLTEGERIVAVGGRHAGRYGVILTVAPSSISALQADALCAAYTARFDDDAPDADDTTLLPHEVRRIPPDGDEVRRVAFEHLEAAAPSAAPATSGRREWTVEEVSVPREATEATEERMDISNAGVDESERRLPDPRPFAVFEACSAHRTGSRTRELLPLESCRILIPQPRLRSRS